MELILNSEADFLFKVLLGIHIVCDRLCINAYSQRDWDGTSSKVQLVKNTMNGTQEFLKNTIGIFKPHELSCRNLIG